MSILNDSRRNFIKLLGMMGAGSLVGCHETVNSKPKVAVEASLLASPRNAAAQYMGDFTAQKLETVRCAFIGVGNRGSGHAEQIAEIEGTEIVAICDLYEDLAKKSAAVCLEKGGGRHTNIALYHGGEDLWKKMMLLSTPK